MIKPSLRFLLGATLACGGCTQTLRHSPSRSDKIEFDWIDAGRQRHVPVVIYGASARARPLAIISNGFGSKNTDYTFLVGVLTQRGFVVASIQQDLPGDLPMASKGNLAVLRRPAWQVGVDSIMFVMAKVAEMGLSRGGRVVLVGHSNGGDISMLFATEHPELTSAVFTLDNRRMPLPLTSRPRICSVRSSDFPADQGVLPSHSEAQHLHMRISNIPALRHDDMWDGATTRQRSAMRLALGACLGSRR